jgi:hypothetical protein
MGGWVFPLMGGVDVTHLPYENLAKIKLLFIVE